MALKKARDEELPLVPARFKCWCFDTEKWVKECVVRAFEA